MGSNMEPVAVNSQKHDPAWKHCQMFKVGDRVQLKCIYCGKIFKGGGIHRIKEHLAGQKGNAATCLRVQSDVRMQMLESLNGVAVRKRKKQKLAEEISGYDNGGTSGVEVVSNSCGLNSDIVLLPVPDMIEHDGEGDGDREDGMSGKTGIRKKKGRVRKANDVNSNHATLAAYPASYSRKTSNLVNMAIGRFFFDVGIPPHAVNSAYFQPMIDVIASQGGEIVGPSYHDVRNMVLKNAVHEVRYDVDQCSTSWGKTGCSILVDEWSSLKGKTFVNFFAYCPEGTIFLRSSDISRAIDSSDLLYELLKEIVEQVGLRNVMQVVTTTEDQYVIAGKRLTDNYPSIFWTPCAGHCIDLMLQDIGELPEVKMILDQARTISRYIYSNTDVINMMRRYTFGVDLVDPGATPSSTNFTTLKRMVNIRHNLQSMVTSEEWMESSYAKDQEGFAVLDSISSQSFWSSCSSITRLIDPLLRLLRIVRSQNTPAMGYVFAGLYRAKEAIKKELDSKEEYSVYWSIIDRRWELLQRHPLHAAGFYLNPKFFYSLEGDGHLHIRSLVFAPPSRFPSSAQESLTAAPPPSSPYPSATPYALSRPQPLGAPRLPSRRRQVRRLKMSKDEVLTVKDVIHKLQLFLLEGIKHENQLLAAGSLISLDDYKDVVTERTIAAMCGYPLCRNSLASERPRKGRYRISLKEHKVYDLQETYMYCSSNCLINSRAFASSLQDERSSTLNPARLNQLLKQFEGSSLESVVEMGKNGELGLADLKIQEKTEREAGEVSWEEWIGPSNAIDGYVPLKDKNLEAHQLKNNKKSGKQEKNASNRMLADPNAVDIMFNDMNFTSTIIFQDEYNVSKTVPPVEVKQLKGKSSCKDVDCKSKPVRKPAASLAHTQEIRSKESDKCKKATGTDDKVNVSEFFASPSQFHDTRAGKKLNEGKEHAAGAAGLKSSLKTSDSRKAGRYVSWADKKTDCDGENLQECSEVKGDKGTLVEEVDEGSDRFASAEACATALSQAAESVASGRSDESDAVSEAGVIILPSLDGVDAAKPEENADVVETDALQLKWPPKPGFSSSELFDSEDSWYESPPEGFNLTLSPFSTMFMALFSWISSSSLAYIYGKEERFCEEYSLVNGREYPHKIVLSDGRSSEIKQTLSGCLARTLPPLVTELRLPIPVSILEQGMGRLLDTMSFIDPIPSFRMKQWQVVVVLFLDALSISRIPSLTQYMRDKRILLDKVLEGAQISCEEFDIMKDLMIPLGRAPHFSTQSGA